MATNIHPSPESVIQGDTWRISILTDRLIRIEWNPTGAFVDSPTQVVVNRSFPKPRFSLIDRPDGLQLDTAFVSLFYNKKPFTPAGLRYALKKGSSRPYGSTWTYGEQPTLNRASGNLGGTARTLDGADGAVDLEPGLLARNGIFVIDDSKSLLVDPDGWVTPRATSSKDLYLFGYGDDYQQELRDYFMLTGSSPIIPRYALGNWWSRFWPYTADEYLNLMDSFSHRGIPLSVSVVDIDWHLTDIDPSIGTGWTGYTWNRTLFPDPGAFLSALHDRHLKVSLNVHPAAGIRRHEEQYPEVAQALGVDPESGVPIEFDVTSRSFMHAYFDLVHHPLEDEGVDFWWIDWQQGNTSKVPGLDPLWMLNHLHTYDAHKRHGSDAIIFSRYAGLGSHRFPLGFSGDSVVSWKSLAFQPYFTATAANVGYYWWSHDIGGHMLGTSDPELETRWVQFGVFSPINRLHSSRSEFFNKEPWHYDEPHASVQAAFLRLRHALIPMLYTAMWNSHLHGKGPVRPIYHDYSGRNEAYEFENTYFFGDLFAAPITSPVDKTTRLATSGVWLPPGRWTDVFTGTSYLGNSELTLHRSLDSIPVLARSGSIIPLASRQALDDQPSHMILAVTEGSGTGELIELDASGTPYRIKFFLNWIGCSLSLTSRTRYLGAATDADFSRIAQVSIELVGIRANSTTSIRGAYKPSGDPSYHSPWQQVTLGTVDLTSLNVHLDHLPSDPNRAADRVFHLLDQANVKFEAKDRAWNILKPLLTARPADEERNSRSSINANQHSNSSSLLAVQSLATLGLPTGLVAAIAEELAG